MSADDSRKKSPFVTVKVVCPVCQKESPQRYIKSKIYQPVEIENDHHVLSYKWTDEEFGDIRPENYYIWHCPHCHFSDENDVFRDKIDRVWQGKLDFIKDKIHATGRDPGSFMNRVGREIDDTQDYICTESAIMALLIACHIQECFLTANNRLPHKLSRFYLRLAWLFRERTAFGSASNAILPDGYFTFEEYLKSLQSFWPEIPLAEKDALNRAVTYYMELLNQSGDEDIKKEVTLMFLLLELNRRSNNLDEAYKYVRNIFTLSMKRRQLVKSALDKGVHSGQISARQIEQMQGLITWLSNAIEQASASGDQINEEIFWDEYERARETALGVQPLLPQKVVEKLRESGLHEITCRKVASLCRPPKGQKFAKTLPTLHELKEREAQQKKALAAARAQQEQQEAAATQDTANPAPAGE